MAKRMIIMLVCLAIFGVVFWEAKQFGIKQYMAGMAKNAPPPPVVTAIKATRQPWQPTLDAVGTMRALRGVDVSTELAGIIRQVHFKSGDEVKAGELLIELNADADVALLNSLKATAELSQTVLARDKQQFEVEAIAKAQIDSDSADLKSKQAQVAQQEALVEKKRIRAPFTGRVGITTVAPGQFVNPGDKLVTLQSIDPIYIDFSLPQQQLATLSIGQRVAVSNDAYPGVTFVGKVNAISPKIDVSTRNVQAEAVVQNTGAKLLPGMFGNLHVDSGDTKSYVTVPQTAVTYNPYGSTVFVGSNPPPTGPDGKPVPNGAPVEKKDANGKNLYAAQQVFVTTGPTRGDQVAILKGLNEGQLVVTSGQLKLKAGSTFTVDDKFAPANDANPTPQEH